MQEGRNSNFPENLNISPSQRPDEVDPGLDSVLDAYSQKDAIEKYGIAGRVWEAAYILLSYMQGSPKWELDPPFLSSTTKRNTYLELGSGTGVVGIKLTQILAPDDLVILTDLPDVCSLLRETLERHGLQETTICSDWSGGLIVRPLPWGDPEYALSIAADLGLTSHSKADSSRYLTRIICSDLVYFPELLAPLLRSLIQLSSPPFVPEGRPWDLEVVISYKIRSLPKETPFWSAFGLWFTFHPVIVRPRGDTDASGDTWRRLGSSIGEDGCFVFIARRRAESFTWSIPESDSDLLSGHGTPWSSDEQFETFLLSAFDDNETDL
ncbi:hypothetical protein GLOTRDRAFT_122699 [Gloeophyllum trabeum ATCC 11539]|uniref:Methyltransferase-domain-containing protein n=1 Tax=Gloeophyllum trabeum (strain ATCC 11539 / FP-39264 / Madison 617) TaxID=670483 RepID=S7PYP1_GLOTA|nr:uncharacterized protein GLOTRDRAFT_122699 [Gloeophyllum trabeum ATCC 11539]EPQ52771.1 hypothetical protein GLOTRDRAFT_122699 [Gloeophyllum trabeum ATCC 11539]